MSTPSSRRPQAVDRHSGDQHAVNSMDQGTQRNDRGSRRPTRPATAWRRKPVRSAAYRPVHARAGPQPRRRSPQLASEACSIASGAFERRRPGLLRRRRPASGVAMHRGGDRARLGRLLITFDTGPGQTRPCPLSRIGRRTRRSGAKKAPATCAREPFSSSSPRLKPCVAVAAVDRGRAPACREHVPACRFRPPADNERRRRRCSVEQSPPPGQADLQPEVDLGERPNVAGANRTYLHEILTGVAREAGARRTVGLHRGYRCLPPARTCRSGGEGARQVE